MDNEELLQKWGKYNPVNDLPNYSFPKVEWLPNELKPVFSNGLDLEMGLPLLLNFKDKLVFKDLYNSPNVLLAGKIASGKTQFIYNQILLWLFNIHPCNVKFVICRSKPIDYNYLLKIENHFLAKSLEQVSPIVEGNTIVSSLNSLNFECENRHKLFRLANVKTIKEYNKRYKLRELDPYLGHHYLTEIVLILDDFQTFVNESTNQSLIVLTQKNLHTGIYVLGVTSQITARNITSQLRANFSVRLAMQLMSQNESRKILDRVGAEKLKSAGDLLYEENGILLVGRQPIFNHTLIDKVCDSISSQKGYSSSLMLKVEQEDDDNFFDQRDELFEETARLIVEHQQGSTSLIQRKLKLGYNRSGRIIDQLEASGILGPFEGSKAREVICKDIESLESYLRSTSLDNGVNYLEWERKSKRFPSNHSDGEKKLEENHSEPLYLKKESSQTEKPGAILLILGFIVSIFLIWYFVVK